MTRQLLSDDEFKNETTATIKTVREGGQMHSQEERLMTTHLPGCTWNQSWPCGKRAGCSEEVKMFIIETIERDDGVTDFGEDVFTQYTPVDNKKGGKYHQLLSTLRKEAEDNGETLNTEDDYVVFDGQRAVYDIIPDRRNPDKPWYSYLKLKGLTE